MKIRVQTRRWISVFLTIILLISGAFFRATGEDPIPYGRSYLDLQNELIELWGNPYDYRIIESNEDGTLMYEAMTFTIDSAYRHRLPNIYTGGCWVLGIAAIVFPQVTALWVISSLCSLIGVGLMPLVWSNDPEINTYRATVTINRYMMEGENPPVLFASMKTSYLCYEKVTDASPPWVDTNSAETSWVPTESDFYSLVYETNRENG